MRDPASRIKPATRGSSFRTCAFHLRMYDVIKDVVLRVIFYDFVAVAGALCVVSYAPCVGPCHAHRSNRPPYFTFLSSSAPATVLDGDDDD